IASFYAYDPKFTGGVWVAAGDMNGDGKADIITGADTGGGPHVEIFDGASGALISSYWAFDTGFRGGVRVAVGDVNGDGRPDVIVGAGPGGGPHVRVFSSTSSQLLTEFFAYDPSFRGGVYVGAGDINRDGRADIMTGAGEGGGPQVTVVDANTGHLL